MKRIGIIGGLGPEATIDYYRLIVNEYREKTNGQYPEVIIYSLNMSEFCCNMNVEAFYNRIKRFADALGALHQGGADFALIASNTPHILFDDLQKGSPLPLVSIVEATCKAAVRANLKRLALLGTKVTMSSDFYQRIFAEEGIEIITPTDEEKEYINDKIISEIIYNQIVDSTRQQLLNIIKRMVDEQHIQGVILGCTELPLILTQEIAGIPFLDTVKIHAKSAVSYSLEENASLKTR